MATVKKGPPFLCISTGHGTALNLNRALVYLILYSPSGNMYGIRIYTDDKRHNTCNINKQSSSVLEHYTIQRKDFFFFSFCFMDVCVCGQTLSPGI
jgi:hypothetical protein